MKSATNQISAAEQAQIAHEAEMRIQEFAEAKETAITIVCMEIMLEAAYRILGARISAGQDAAAASGNAWAEGDIFVQHMPDEIKQALGTARAYEMLGDSFDNE